MTQASDFRPVTDDPGLMAELVAKYVDDDMPDQDLYALIVEYGIQPPADVSSRDDKRNLFAVLYTDDTRQTGTLVWD